MAVGDLGALGAFGARAALWCVVLTLCVPSVALAQRELHWSRFDVEATLAADGTLRVDETQTMVFTGDWNGGERRFDIRPRQSIALLSLARATNGTWRALSEDSALDEMDDYAWIDATTLRWRSRLTGDRPFADTEMRYLLRYELKNILLEDGNDFVLDHDFLFPDRAGRVERFALRLHLDPAWQPTSEQPQEYVASNLAPGRGFVVTMPLRFTGAGRPTSLDTSRPPAITAAVTLVVGVTALMVLWLFVREQSVGRFAPVAAAVDEAWLRANILKYPAEVVGAAWDEHVGTPEVVALIARMVEDGKLESDVKGKSSMSLHLRVDRDDLRGHERTLVDRLFFDGRTQTSTDQVKEHYRAEGFRPADEIRKELEAAVDEVMPAGQRPRSIGFLTGILLLAGFGLLLWDAATGDLSFGPGLAIGGGALVLVGIGAAAGTAFHSSIHWGRRQALACLVPAILSASVVSYFLWFYAGLGSVTLSTPVTMALASLTLAIVWANVNAMSSKRHPAAIAFRKILAAGQHFFARELRQQRPALRDEWMPWLLAYGLGPRVDDWSARQSNTPARSTGVSHSSGSSDSFGSTSSNSSWTGFSGGRSGGAGGGASWAAAATGLAAGVSPPSSSGSGGSSSGGSSSGGSSGGGGGGGW